MSCFWHFLHILDLFYKFPQEIQIFTMRMEDISSRISIPKEVFNCLWENIAHIVTHTLVEGFAFTKKCSNGGRALMQLDFTQLQSKFEKISGLRPMPHREYVESYVKAYYLPEIELEKWIREHNVILYYIKLYYIIYLLLS